MKKAKAFTLLLGALAASGCVSTRGGQDVACADFANFAVKPVPNQFVRDIQRYAPADDGRELTDSPVQRAIGELFDAGDALTEANAAAPNILLLSGGGQWGAYGTGLFLGIACSRDGAGAWSPSAISNTPCMDPEGRLLRDQIDLERIDAMNIRVVTGVSTGGLQSILLMVVIDSTLDREVRMDALQRLIESCRPDKESDLVNRNPMFLAALTGSVAGTDPLRRHVEGELELDYPQPTADAPAAPTTPLIELIGSSAIKTFIGIVDADSGDFKSVPVTEMVRLLLYGRDASGSPTAADRETASQCVLAATLASAAMPGFHQQMRVEQEGDEGLEASTLFDGGVRRSVFLAEIGEAFRVQSERRRRSNSSAPQPNIFVLRNGPTFAKEDKDVDAVAGALPQVMRACSLIVNELEVNSIASLRLAYPQGPVWVSTADGSEHDGHRVPFGNTVADARTACKKEAEEMFNPQFMRCLMFLGAWRGFTDKDIFQDDQAQVQAFWRVSEVPR